MHWLGPLSENQIWVDGDDNFKDLPDNFLDLPDDFDLSNWDILELPDGFSFRLLLQLTIAQSTQKSYLKQVDLYMNQQALSNQRKCWDMTPRLELMDGPPIPSILPQIFEVTKVDLFVFRHKRGGKSICLNDH